MLIIRVRSIPYPFFLNPFVMTLKEAVVNIEYRFGETTNIPFKDRLRRSISVARAEILRREINKKGSLPYAHAHTLTKLEILEDKLGYLNSSDSKKKVWKTVERVPKPLMYHDQNPGFIFVGSLDQDNPHSFIRPERLAVRTTQFKQNPYYTYMDGYIFFFDNIKVCNVRAIYSDMIALETIKNKDNQICVPEIIISDDLFTGILGLILEKEGRVTFDPEVEVNADRQ